MGFGGKNTFTNSPPQYSGLSVQTAVSTLPVPIVYGRCRIPPNLIWYDGFQAIPTYMTMRTGKHSSTTTTTYTYQASMIMALCQGPITLTGVAWRDKLKYPGYPSLGMTLFTGADPQSGWSYLQTAFPTAALNYNGLCYMGAPNYNLGNANSLGAHTFEVYALLANTAIGGNGDADPAQVILDFFTNVDYGVQYPLSSINTSTLLSTGAAITTGDGTYQTYCRASGYGISPNLNSARSAGSIAQEWLDATNTVTYFDGSRQSFVPLGDKALTANGVTYLPNITPVYTITDFDVVGTSSKESVQVERSDPSDSYNVVQINYTSLVNEYIPLTVTATNTDAVQKYGYRFQSALDFNFITRASMASSAANLIVSKNVGRRNVYRFTLGIRHCLITPGDVLNFNEPLRLGVSNILMRVEDAQESADGNIAIVARELAIGSGATGTYSNQVNFSAANTSADASVNTTAAIIFEPPAVLSGGSPELWISLPVATAGDPGGTFQTYLSLDGVKYFPVLTRRDTEYANDINIQSFMTAPMAANATSGSFGIDRSQEDYIGGSGGGGAYPYTLYVQSGTGPTGDYMSYSPGNVGQSPPLTYNITGMTRGLFGVPAVAHAIGDKFVVLSDLRIHKLGLLPGSIGKTLYFKFLASNLTGQIQTPLTAVAVQTYVVNGASTKQAPPTSPTNTTSLVSQPDGTRLASLTVTWAPDTTTAYIDHYDIQTSIDGGTTWVTAGVAGAGSTSYTITPVLTGTTYQTRVRTVSSSPAIAPSPYVSPAAPIATATTVAPVRPFVFAMSAPIASIPVSGEIAGYPVAAPFSLPATLAASKGFVSTAPTTATNFDIRKNGISIGTMSFASASTAATFSMASSVNFALGDWLTLYSPATLNGMTGPLDVSILGQLI